MQFIHRDLSDGQGSVGTDGGNEKIKWILAIAILVYQERNQLNKFENTISPWLNNLTPLFQDSKITHK